MADSLQEITNDKDQNEAQQAETIASLQSQLEEVTTFNQQLSKDLKSS